MTTALKFEPPVIAHRGASGYVPENTLAAFKKAKALGIKWVEFDVVEAGCGELIVFHDEILDRTTNGKGIVIDYPYDYLRSLDAGSWFHPSFDAERIPTFEQVLTLLKKEGLSANVEIKTLPGREAKQVQKMIEVIKPFISDEQTFLFSSFSIEALKFLRHARPHFLIGLLLHEWLPDWEAVTDSLRPVSLHINDEILTPATAAKVKAKKKQLLSYTVNDPARAKILFSWGVDAVFSDVPDKILAGLMST